MKTELPLHLSLDGTWDFFYSPKPLDPLKPILPKAEQFTGLMVTPGYWDCLLFSLVNDTVTLFQSFDTLIHLLGNATITFHSGATFQ